MNDDFEIAQHAAPPVRPFWGRVAVQPCEEAPASGLVLPDTVKKSSAKRGIVVAVDDDLLYSFAAQQIPPGTVVHYHGAGEHINGVVIIEPHQIIAYEIEP